MHRFVDEINIRIKAGDGGAGCVSFLHEKFLEFGGPDGGDGGDGGDVFIVADNRILTLSHLRENKLYKAQNGKPGMGSQCSGKRGRDLTLKVPFGTQLIDADSGDVVHDFLDTEVIRIATGARGGKGNAFFKSATRQAPRFAQPGETTEEHPYTLSLKLIADIGLVGFPNAGKSTLLKALTRANPRIASYPFTTISPNLGVIEDDVLGQILVADIPGILEGASKGYGLGLSFLKHIERVRLIVYVLDLGTSHLEEELRILQSELQTYNAELLSRPFLILLNKADLIEDREFLNEWVDSFRKLNVQPLTISALSGEGVSEIRETLRSMIAKLRNSTEE
ncbi:MAG: GTPase ObgE [Leptospiraceae bacterium]|nr:GTPase ObgE [Leptospiraceae bacterium]